MAAEPDLTAELDAAEAIVMGGATVGTDPLPPTQYLVMEVLLAARYRLGEHHWTFPAKLRPALEALSRLGLLWWKHATIPGYCIAVLTKAGQRSALSETYKSPADDLGEHLDADHRTMIQLGRIADAAIKMLEHINMDTDEDRELHARAVGALRGRLDELAAAMKEANEAADPPGQQPGTGEGL